jgi:hypothetical protein
MGFSELMSLIGTVTAVVGGLAGLAALVISLRADRRAARAEKQTDQSRQRALWSELIVAMQEVIGLSVLHQDVRPVLLRVRTAMTEVVDGMPAGEYPNLDKWLFAEHRVVSLQLEKALLNLNRSPVTVDDIEAAHRPANNWATGFLNNLRVARKTPAGAEVNGDIADLARHAEETAEKLLDELRKASLPEQ